MRVLIVDDDFAALRAARRALHDEETFIASDTATAIELAARHRPDAILVDIQLGNENGLEAVNSLLAASPGSAVIATSGNDRFKLDAWASGAHAWVPKRAWPKLAGIVFRVLEIHQGEQQLRRSQQ
jgi:DNA-binding response OmpR family regulator